jgi:hypothetical protein
LPSRTKERKPGLFGDPKNYLTYAEGSSQILAHQIHGSLRQAMPLKV